MSRNQIRPLLMLLAAAALTGPLVAQKPTQEPPKERPPAKKVEEAPKGGAPTAEAREIAKKAAHFEALHRDRIARIDRLIAIYTAKGDREKVTELEALRDSQRKRHANAMDAFRKQLGAEDFGRLEKEMKGPSARGKAERDEHANQNEKEREARKAEKAKEDAHPKEQPKDKPPARQGGKKEGG